MVVIAFLVPLAILTRDLAADRERAAAEREAASLARLIVVVQEAGRRDAIISLTGPEGIVDGRPVTVMLPDGVLIGAPLADGEDLTPAIGGTTFRQAVSGGEAVYVPVITGEGTYVVRVMTTSEALTEGVARAWLLLGALGVILVLLAVVITDRLAHSVVQPVTELSEAAHELGRGDLETRVVPAGPREVHEVGVAFNTLAIQIEGLLQQEREDAADLAHRLRTPLAAARLIAEGLPADERRQALLDQLDELHRVVDHIIDEARRPARQTVAGSVDAIAAIEQRAAFWEPLATDEDRSLDVTLPSGEALVALPAADLSAALDALIGNVFAHTEAGTGLRLLVQRSDGAIEITVEDDGAGFPEGIDATDRGLSSGASTGLGLDIALRTAESAGGELRAGTAPGGGARVTMRLPTV